MKTLQRFSRGAFVALAAGVVVVASAAGTERTRASIESQEQALTQASQRGDAAAMASLFTEDAKISVPGTQGIVAGRAAIQAFWQAALSGGMKEISLATAELEGDGSWRYETGRYSALGANGAELGSGEYMLIWKKEGGAWKIHRDYGHPGALRPAAAAVSAATRRRDVSAGNTPAMPTNYRREFKALGTAFNERSSEITATFANAAASIERAAQLPYADGAVFVMEFASPRRDGEGQLLRDSAGKVLQGEILHIDVMRKIGAAAGRGAAATAGSWEFASYRADGSVAIASADAAHCADCHRNAGDAKDFVFRLRAPLGR
jgi:uncharacterized protein (TIGR02246 family)